MKTATIRQVRNEFGHVLRWIAEGEEVTVLKRRQVVARILPPRPQPPVQVHMPDFAARLKTRFGGRRTGAVEAVVKEREQSRS